MKRYIVLGCCRSGTTVTHLTIKGHPNVCALNDELLVTPFYNKGISSFTQGHDLEIEKQNGHKKIFDAITSIQKNEQTIYTGLKTSLNYNRKYIDYIKDVLNSYFPNIKIIITIRNDLVAQYGSWIRAMRTGKHHSWDKSIKEIKTPISINKYLFIKYLFDCFWFIDNMRDLKKTHDVLEFSYENDISNGRFEKLFDFLELDNVDINWLEAKKVSPKPENYIKNYKLLTNLFMELESMYYNDNLSTKYKLINKIVCKYVSTRKKTKNIINILRNQY